MQAAGLIPQAQSELTRRQFLAIGWTVAGLVAAGEAGWRGVILAFMYRVCRSRASFRGKEDHRIVTGKLSRSCRT